MTSNGHHTRHGASLRVVLAALLAAATQARAAEYWLRADATTRRMPDGTDVPLWGYRLCGDGTAASCGEVRVPGPELAVGATDTTGLTVHLANDLAEPTSLVVNGLVADRMTPVWFVPGSSPPRIYQGARPPRPADPIPAGDPRDDLTARVRSFTHEAAPGGSADYSWPGVGPGTYLYQSGTHPQVQVQMGLYGAVTRNAADANLAVPSRAQAYAGVEYDRAVTVIYSEIDPALHLAYGTSAAPTSTFDYQPRYFLVNGWPYPAGADPLAAVGSGQRVLLRFLNAGLRTHVPMILGAHMELVAEDGQPYPWPAHPRKQATALLPAAKTLDAIVTTYNVGAEALRLPILDRRLDVTNAGAPDGGLISFLEVTPSANGAPSITSTPSLAASVGVEYAYQATSSDPDPGDVPSWSLDVAPAGMTITAGGLVRWTPAASQVGDNPVSVRVTDLGGASATQGFTIAVVSANHAPVAVDDGPFTMVEGGTLAVAAPGVLANDTDQDGDPLTAVGYSAQAGLSGNANGSFSWTLPLGITGARTFTYSASDGTLTDPATVTVNVLANRPPSAADDSFSAGRRTNANSGSYAPVVLNVTANDSDPDTALDPANAVAPTTTAITVQPNKGGTVTRNADGTFSYLPKLNFRGTDTFQYRVRDTRGALSNAATVRVNVQ